MRILSMTPDQPGRAGYTYNYIYLKVGFVVYLRHAFCSRWPRKQKGPLYRLYRYMLYSLYTSPGKQVSRFFSRYVTHYGISLTMIMLISTYTSSLSSSSSAAAASLPSPSYPHHHYDATFSTHITDYFCHILLASWRPNTDEISTVKYVVSSVR